ncbi:DUF1648 domain-containing protein [Aestuariimicrobium sp. T2.26MG-19.2B]|uniref:DUF1648 domain-containing protein n=1 Tax=Aestuariimicrobium sp. T2.26MG-19.2B TaxID=3040679 RepID=UPI002477606F|nr:DUF1648 domain-containing protein [Aestuariimicrobium sp. T2.26MG-19.2B]CAI9401906.1 hypothetical protein AESSP_00690 [Aestuariimicrobium sp. T2.26MG-19.2B]
MSATARPGGAALAVAVPVVTALLVLGVTSAWAWSVRDSLGDRVAVHWGVAGRPDRWTSLTSALVTTAVLTGVMTALLVGLAVVMRDRIAVPSAASGMAVFLAGSGNGLLVTQAGDPNHRLGFELVFALVAGLVVGVLVAVVLRALDRRRPHPVAARPTPAAGDASVPPMPWSGLTRTGTAVYVLPLVGMAPTAVLLAYAAVYRVWGLVVFMLILMLVMGLLLTMLKCEVTVDERGLRATGGRLTWLNVPLEQIESAEVDHVEPMRDFGGWGIRFGPRGLGLVTSRGAAVWVQRAGGRPVCVTVTEPEACAAAVNSWARVG